ncbi:MAG: Rieske 2Fe-2S domain-containing protein [Armatimonadota bacterium]|nr:Rieske 2Fe-2S domain-containing protein [Armatimonadota bacterium]MDR7520622.1 Rieske 2Fe-2S domain-containing protein [Armatimonadota bacterium]MDR7550485.1 Rieske 2Fe-2S domain-containing protein [Armatimonadota bacterium]
MARHPEMDRRRFLKMAASLPIAGGLIAFGSPLLRFLKPNVDPFAVLTPTAEDVPTGEPIVAAALSEIPRPWDFKYFVFTQKYPQYTPEGFKTQAVPGVVIRLPRKIRLPWAWVRQTGETPQFEESEIIAFSRICPHLGCIYNYVPEWREITSGYGGYVPEPSRRHALMGCPCHLSIYDPADPEQPGRVLSGPAPRPPRTFFYELQQERILVKRVEPGGIA